MTLTALAILTLSKHQCQIYLFYLRLNMLKYRVRRDRKVLLCIHGLPLKKTLTVLTGSTQWNNQYSEQWQSLRNSVKI